MNPNSFEGFHLELVQIESIPLEESSPYEESIPIKESIPVRESIPFNEMIKLCIYNNFQTLF